MKTRLITLRDNTTMELFEGDHITRQMDAGKNYYELAMLEHIRRASRGGTYIDVGANVGNHTVFFAKYCASRVVAFEPFVPSYTVLTGNVHRNSLINVTASCLGLSDGEYDASMSNVAGNIGMAHVDEGGEHRCRLTTLDKFCWFNRVEDVTCIKLDCEGHELKAIEGAVNTIARWRPDIYAECQTGEFFQKVRLRLADLGYRDVAVFNSTPTYQFRYVGPAENGFT